MINAKQSLFGALNIGTLSEDVEIKEHYLDDIILNIVLTNGQILTLDISEYFGDITEDKIEALNNMTISIENGELIFSYDESILNMDFNIDDGDLIVEDNDRFINLSINENKELEVGY